MRLVGLAKAPELNNTIGLVIGSADKKTGRFVVQLTANKREIGIKPDNLVVLTQTEVNEALGPSSKS